MKLLKYLGGIIIIVIVYFMITNAVDDFFAYKYVKKFYKKNSQVFDSIENYLNNNYTDSINSNRFNDNDWYFGTQKKVNEFKHLNPKAHDYDRYLDSNLNKLEFSNVRYNSKTKSISYVLVDFPKMFFNNRFYFKITNTPGVFDDMPLGDGYYLIMDDVSI